MLRRTGVKNFLRKSRTMRNSPYTTNQGGYTSFRAAPMVAGLAEVKESPYKEAFKEYWSQPVPWQDREYGRKPKLGEPIPLRRSTSVLVVAKNNHHDPSRVTEGEDNDYKILMMHRHGRGRFTKDECLIPAAPVELSDQSKDWDGVLHRCGVTTEWDDITTRIAATRALLVEDNLLLIPRKHGSIAEVQGPPGPKKWHMIVHSNSDEMRRLMDVLEPPMEEALKELKPFRRIQTPETEMFRFDNHVYTVCIDKMPDVRYTISTVGEKLFWISPKEAVARHKAGLLEMPTPNLILMSELANTCPRFADVDALQNNREPEVITPELVYREDNMSTILLPGDMSHSQTTPEAIEDKFLRRIVYTRGEVFGAEADYIERVAEPEDDVTPVTKAAPKMLEEMNEFDAIYEGVELPKREFNKDNLGKVRQPLRSLQMKDQDFILDEMRDMEREDAVKRQLSASVSRLTLGADGGVRSEKIPEGEAEPVAPETVEEKAARLQQRLRSKQMNEGLRSASTAPPADVPPPGPKDTPPSPPKE